MKKKERLLLKVSGANLKVTGSSDVISDEVIGHLVDQIKELSKDCEVAVIVGGGNVWRGDDNDLAPLGKQDSHVMGMLATMINSVALQNYLRHRGVKSTIFSAISCSRIAEDICTQSLENAFNKGHVVVFAGGTGMPYVTTDTCAAVRSLEINADKIFIAKNGVDGIYDGDPKKNPNAKFYERVSYEEIIEKRLEVMDLSAMTLLIKNKRPKLVVFNQSVRNGFVKALKGEIKSTEVY